MGSRNDEDRIEEIRNRFRVEPSDDLQAEQLRSFVGQIFLGVADNLSESLPHCRETKQAMANLEQAFFWALAAVNREQHVRREQDIDEERERHPSGSGFVPFDVPSLTDTTGITALDMDDFYRELGNPVG